MDQSFRCRTCTHFNDPKYCTACYDYHLFTHRPTPFLGKAPYQIELEEKERRERESREKETDADSGCGCEENK